MQVYILLDRSGSMVSKWNEVIPALDTYISLLDKSVKVHYSVFDDTSTDIVFAGSVSEWLDTKDYSTKYLPRGGTPLYDAVWSIMDLADLANEEKRVLVIITDGYENASRKHTRDEIEARFDEWKEKGYEIVFLGAEFQDVKYVQANLGIDLSKTNVIAKGEYMDKFRNLSGSTMAYATNNISMDISQL